jgi:hypothetical protein
LNAAISLFVADRNVERFTGALVQAAKASGLQGKSRCQKPIERGRTKTTLKSVEGREEMLRITTSHSAEAAKNYFDVSLKTSDYYKVALRDADSRPSKRLSSWELLEGDEKDRALRAELNRQRAKAKEEQQKRTYQR